MTEVLRQIGSMVVLGDGVVLTGAEAVEAIRRQELSKAAVNVEAKPVDNVKISLINVNQEVSK